MTLTTTSRTTRATPDKPSIQAVSRRRHMAGKLPSEQPFQCQASRVGWGRMDAMGQASLIEEREDAPSSPAPDEANPPGWARRVWQHVWLPLLAALPALAGLVDVCRSLGTGRYLPYADHAILALKAGEVGCNPFLVGAWSRFGGAHPGPLEHYVLGVPYRLLGETPEALAIGTLL